MQFIKQIDQACESLAAGQELDMASLAAFEWDTLIVVGPYTPHTAIEQVLGGPLPSIVTDLGIEGRDDVHVLIFGQQAKVVRAVAMPRRIMEFRKPDLLLRLPRPQARFVSSGLGRQFDAVARK